MNASQHANEILNHVQDAVGEIAHDMLSPGSGFLDAKWKKWVQKAKKAGCRDLRGSLADALYNDPDTLTDLMGDRLCEASDGDPVLRNAILDELGKKSFTGMTTAVASLRRDFAEVTAIPASTPAPAV